MNEHMSRECIFKASHGNVYYVSLQAKRSRRSLRSRRPFASPVPSDSTSVLRQPDASPYHGRLRTRLHDTPTADAHPPVSTLNSAQAPALAEDAAERPTRGDERADGRETRSLRRQDREQRLDRTLGIAAGPHRLESGRTGRNHDVKGGTDNHGDSAHAHDDQHQRLSNGRALRSRRVRVEEPNEAQLQSDDDAQLAQALQESLLSQPPPVRRSGRSTRAAVVSNQARADEAADEAAGPSYAAEQASPGASRELRAQQRALRTQQTYMHESSPEPGRDQMNEAEEHYVRRSQRQQTRASSASVEASHRAFGAAQRADAPIHGADPAHAPPDDPGSGAHDSTRQGLTGIKITLRPSGASRQNREQSADANVAAAPANSSRTGLRVSLRPRRS